MSTRRDVRSKQLGALPVSESMLPATLRQLGFEIIRADR